MLGARVSLGAVGARARGAATRQSRLLSTLLVAEHDGANVSEATRAKMSAMFMEDEVLPDTTLDDTVLRMEAALAAAKGEAAAEEKVEEKPSSSIDDGW